MNQNTTVEHWMKYWLDFYEKPFIKPTTYTSYQGYINNHFYPILDLDLKDLNTEILQGLCNKLYQTLSSKTVRNIFICLRTALNQAVSDNLITQNYAQNVKLPKSVKPKIRILTETEKTDLIRASYSNEYGVFIRLVLCTGIRLGELLGLKWSDINFKDKILYIRRTLNRVKNFDPYDSKKTILKFLEPKTSNSIREIPLPENAIQDLLYWKEFQKKILHGLNMLLQMIPVNLWIQKPCGNIIKSFY